MFITAIAAVMSYAGLNSAINLAESAQQETDRLQQINRVFSIMARDFQQILPRKVRSPDANEFESAMVFNESSYPMLKFSRDGWANPQPARFQRSQLQRVHYHFDGGKLTRSSWMMLDRFSDSEAQEFTLLEDVESFSMKFYATEAELPNGIRKAQWLSQWPPETLEAYEFQGVTDLPLAIELNIRLKSWGEITRYYELADNAP